MAYDLILDMETLGQAQDAAILSIAMLPIDFHMQRKNKYVAVNTVLSNGIHLKLNVKDQVKTYGRKIDESTVNWWKSQGDEAKHVLAVTDNDILLSDAINQISVYIKKYKPQYIWTRGMIDGFWLQSLCNNVNMPVTKDGLGAHWGSFRDIRTMIDVMSGSTSGYIENDRNNTKIESTLKSKQCFKLTKHDALHDCLLDYIQMSAVTSEIEFSLYSQLYQQLLTLPVEYDDIPF